MAYLISIRLFTVYGPWGRPDMAPMIFTKSILEKKPIKIFNNGEMWRDFTYVDDVIFCIESLIDKALYQILISIKWNQTLLKLGTS